MDKQIVLVIGAGIAGLVAARELADKYHVIILEAAARAGGRIHTLQNDGFNDVIEGGAEFLHGTTRHTKALLKEAGIGYTPVEGKMYRSEKGQWKEQQEMIEGWDKLLQKMGELEQDMTLYDFMQRYYAGAQYEALRAHVTSYAEGFDCADVRKASTKALYEEWAHEGEQFRVKGGYGTLVSYMVKACLKKGCELVLSEAVKQLDWRKDMVTAYTANGKKYEGAKCIITLPVTILQLPAERMAIGIEPMPAAYKNALQQIGFGTVIKIVMQFAEPFWQKDTGFIISDEQMPTWWTQSPSPAPILTCWVAGTRAEQLSSYTDDELQQLALTSLSNLFKLDMNSLKENLQAAKVFNWKKNEMSLGCYSYATPASAAARNLLCTPMEDTIYLAGEGLYQGPFPGTVEAAIVNALDTVKKLL